MRHRTLLIDDEPPARQRLKELLALFPDTFDVVGEAAGGTEALQLIPTMKPGLLFLDIQMPGMSGFELIQQLEDIPIIVFCTAYDQYALQAFETNGMDYLVKPVRRERIEQTVKKLELFGSSPGKHQIQELLKAITAQTEKKILTSITIRSGNKMRFIKLEDITYMRAADKYVSIYNTKGEESITDLSLTQLEGALPEYFLRIHRSLIINTRFLTEVETHFCSRYIITLSDHAKTRLTSGRTYQPQIKAWMQL